MKVLVIDDDPAILDLVSQYLSLSAQYDVQSVATARDALEAVKQAETPFDVFLVDIQMPGVDGITLIEFIREAEGYRETPIVMLTAMQEKSYLDRAFSAGATDYITKPFDFLDLRQRLEDAKARVAERDVARRELPDGAGAEVVGLHDPVALPDVESAIDYGEFENYVRQLMSQRLYRATAIAVKIAGVGQIHGALSGEAFREVLRDVALAAEKSLLPAGGLLTYRGNGVFLCIPENRLMGRRAAMQKALNKQFARDYPASARLAPTLLIGDQVPLGDGKGVSLLATLAKAVDSLEGQHAGIGEILDKPKRFLRGQGRYDVSFGAE